MNILSNLQEIANIIIRPSRYTYKITDLGNKTFKINDKTVYRQDFQIKNPRNMKIKASIYSTQQFKNIQHVVIYLHCNSGCRIQGLSYLKLAIQNDLSYVVFDFTGSGMSDGKYVSLGFYQTIDLQCVYLHFKSILNEKTKFILWGRSMGAVTALNFLLKNKYDIFMAIFDSPFRSLKQLFIQIGRQKTSFPDFILQMAYNYLKPIILQKAEFDIQQVGLKIENNNISIPGIFVASKQDLLVPFQQIDEIFRHYKGQKQMLFIQQGHNQARNIKIINEIFKSIKKQILSQQIRKRQQQKNKQQKKNYYSELGKGRTINLQNMNNPGLQYTNDINNNMYTNNEYQNNRLDKKQLSRKKLQLTIKSYSQRQLLTNTIGKILKDQQLLQQRKSTINIKNTKKSNQLNANINIDSNQSSNINIKNNNQAQSKIKNNQINNLQSNKSYPFKINQSIHNQQINTQTQYELQKSPKLHLQKKPISCLLPYKKSLKLLSHQQQSNRLSFQQPYKKLQNDLYLQTTKRSINKTSQNAQYQQSNKFVLSEKKMLMNNKSESKLNIKKKPLQIKNFFNNQNSQSYKNKQNHIKIQQNITPHKQINKQTNRLVNYQITKSDNKQNNKQLKLNYLRKTQVLKEKLPQNNNILKHSIKQSNLNKQQNIIKQPIKNLSAVYNSKPYLTPQSPKQLPLIQTMKRPKLILGQSSSKKMKQKEQPHSQIKNENKVNFHEDVIKQRQFLKRCQSLQKIYKIEQIKQNNDKLIKQQPTTHSYRQINNKQQTYRQIKCTERVLQKIIQKQQRKLLILNIQNIQNKKVNHNINSMCNHIVNHNLGNDNSLSSNQLSNKNVLDSNQSNSQVLNKQRKTMQHIIHKKPPFVQLKGLKNFRNSLQTKYKTQIRK